MNRSSLKSHVVSLALGALLSTVPAHAQPPVESGRFRKSDLVELVKLDPTIHLDIRYATADNFLGVPLYKQARAFLQRPAAEALVRVNRALHRRGLGLLVFDGYRPWHATKFMWDHSRPEWQSGGYVADPAKGSRHNRGCAVDLTLYDVKTGHAVTMPTGYDDFHEQAHAAAQDVPPLARTNRTILQKAMLAEGFMILPEEWWHFDYKDYKVYPIVDVDFADLHTPDARPKHMPPAPATQKVH